MYIYAHVYKRARPHTHTSNPRTTHKCPNPHTNTHLHTGDYSCTYCGPMDYCVNYSPMMSHSGVCNPNYNGGVCTNHYEVCTPSSTTTPTAAPTAAPTVAPTHAPAGCADDTSWSAFGGGQYTCAWWAANDPGCTYYQDDGQIANCPVTCNTCPSPMSAPTMPSPNMTSLPISSKSLLLCFVPVHSPDPASFAFNTKFTGPRTRTSKCSI